MQYKVVMTFTRESAALYGTRYDRPESAAAAIVDVLGWDGFCLGDWHEDADGADSCPVYESEADRQDDATAGARQPRVKVAEGTDGGQAMKDRSAIYKLIADVRAAIEEYDTSKDHMRHDRGADCIRCKLDAVVNPSGGSKR